MRRRGLLDAAAAAAALAGLALAGCGFQPRRPATLSFSRVALEGFAERSALADALRRELARQVTVVPSRAQAEVVVVGVVDLREKSVVAQTSAAQVRAFNLRSRLRFRAETPSGRVLVGETVLVLERDMSYSETMALAKEQEEASILREMHADLVTQVMRRLETIRL